MIARANNFEIIIRGVAAPCTESTSRHHIVSCLFTCATSGLEPICTDSLSINKHICPQDAAGTGVRRNSFFKE